MKWLEIIELTSVESNQETLEIYLNMLIRAVKKDLKSSLIRVYCKSGLALNYSIHLYHLSDKIEKDGSLLGSHLSAGLKEFGLVNHSIWLEKQES